MTVRSERPDVCPLKRRSQPQDRLSLSCTAGVRFRPSLKAGVSTEVS